MLVSRLEKQIKARRNALQITQPDLSEIAGIIISTPTKLNMARLTQMSK